MTTVLGECLENSILTLESTVGYGGIDPDTGNPTPIKSTLQVDALLFVNASKSRENPQPGNPNQLWAEGNVTRVFDSANPSVDLEPVLPKGIPTGVPIKISGVVGKIFLERVPIDAAIDEYDCLDIVGEYICGWFEPERL
jgi:hypothetical protein